MCVFKWRELELIPTSVSSSSQPCYHGRVVAHPRWHCIDRYLDEDRIYPQNELQEPQPSTTSDNAASSRRYSDLRQIAYDDSANPVEQGHYILREHITGPAPVTTRI